MTKKNSHVEAKLFTKFVDILVKISRDGSENSNGEKAVLVPAGCIQANCQEPQLLGPVCFPIRCDQCTLRGGNKSQESQGPVGPPASVISGPRTRGPTLKTYRKMFLIKVKLIKDYPKIC